MAAETIDPPAQPSEPPARPDRNDAENVVRTLIRWAGDDPAREGLLDTPARVVRAYEEFFAGYLEDPVQTLSRTFSEVDGYDEMIVMTDIRFESHCEHHMVPIIGKAHLLPCQIAVWWASPSLPAWSTSMPNVCRSRKE